MVHPYIDCARRLARAASSADDIVEMVCEVGEGTVHRLWEPLADKQTPAQRLRRPSSPRPIASPPRFLARQPRPRRLHRRRRCRSGACARSPPRSATGSIPDNPYPDTYTGHIRATLRDGRALEERQPHLRGGAQEPLTRAELEEKFARNAGAGGWPPARLADALALARTLFDGAVDLGAWRG